MNPKCSLNPEEREKIFGRFTGHMDIETERQITELFPQYLFFRSIFEDDGWSSSGSSFRLCTCSACGYEFEGVRINGARGKVHNEAVTCPSCGRQLTGKAVYKFKYDMPGLQSWIKTAMAWADGEGGIMIEAADARRRFTHDELTGTIDWYPKARYYFAPGKIQMWKQIIEEWACIPGQARLSWQPSKTIGDPFNPQPMGMNPYYGEYQVIGLKEALQKSAFRYCGMEDFYHFGYAVDMDSNETARHWVKYLAYAALYPQIEMAVKWNLLDAVHELITGGKKNAKVLNWSGTSPAAFLRMEKGDARAFIRSGLDFSDLRLWKETAPELGITAFSEIRNQFSDVGLKNLQECAQACGESLMSCAKYIQSLSAPCARYAVSGNTIASIWKDYLHMAVKLGYDLSEKTVRMPKDLRERHDAAAAMINIQKNELERKAYKKRLLRLKKRYEFSLGGLTIVIPECGEDIVTEGKILRHCVGGYAARHIEGKTTILFLRHKRRPERSFLTIELDDERERNVRIRQIHGYRNEGYNRTGAAPIQKYAWFLNPWLAWVNAGSKRDRSGAPIINEEVKTA